MNMNNDPFIQKDSTILQQDSRYKKAVEKEYPKPNIFNSKKIAEQLLEEREEILTVAKDFELFTAADILKSLDEGYTYQDELNKQIQQSHLQLQEIQATIISSKDQQEFQSFGMYDYEHPAQNSIQLANELKTVRANIKALITNKKAASATQGFTFNNSEAQGKKFVNDMVKLMLRAYNAEAENAVKSVKSDKSEAAIKRLNRCKDQVEKLGKMIDLAINPHFHKARLREIQLAFEYHSIVRIEREIEREAAAELREQKKAEAEFKKRQEKLEKELRQKQIAQQQLQQKQKESNEALSADDIVQLEKLTHEIESIVASISDTQDRAANLQAGYVYVISNLGSFGEGRIKIGMTRRVDPMERVKELGSASVPFEFDVHLLHYSEHALEIEKKLHHYFANRRVNLINKRKEHFYASPHEVREAISQLGLDGVITTFSEKIEATNFLESQNIRNHQQQSSV